MPNNNGILDDDSNMDDEFGNIYDIRVYPLDKLMEATQVVEDSLNGISFDDHILRWRKPDGRFFASKAAQVLSHPLEVYSTFATAYIRKVKMEASSSQDDFDATAEQLLNEYGEPDTYVVGYYNKQTHWLDHVVFHPDNTTISP